jgi:hypothetical protein
MKNSVFLDVAPCRSCLNRRFASIFRVEKSATEESARVGASDLPNDYYRYL